MNRREFLHRSAVAIAAAACARIESSRADTDTRKRRPNVLYVFSDQHRAASLPDQAYNQALAPNIDAFRRQSLSMETCVSNYPLCTPYRGILMTGRWPHQTGLIHNGVPLGTGEVSLGTTFQKAGYHTGYVGKWHLSGEDQQFIPKGPERQGFEDWHVWCGTNNHYHAWTYDPDTGEKIQPQGWNCTLMTDQAIAFLRRQSEDRPWLLMLSWNPPHPPFNPPAQDTEKYPPENLRLRPNTRLSLSGLRGKQARRGQTKFLTSEELLHQAVQGYYGAITGVDAEFARLLQVLDDSGQARDTIVVYTSDHGEMMGSHGRMGKQVPFEESCRVPFLVRYPGYTPVGGKSDALFAAIDIFPTLCGLAGISKPPSCGGRDLSGLMTGRTMVDSPEIVFLMNQADGLTGAAGSTEDSDESDLIAREFVQGPNYRGARTRTHTYAVTATGRWCLYDNVADPYQLKNLVRDPAQEKLMAELDAKILHWLEATGDPFPYREALDRASDFPV